MAIMRYLLAVLLLLNIGCSGSPTEPQTGGSTVTLRFSETATLFGNRVSFTEINDSRCPKDVACVWAGDAAVRLKSGTEELVLHSNAAAGPASGKLAGLTVTLLDVKPERVTGEVDKTAYVVTLRVTR
jgi:hypothetical protein